VGVSFELWGQGTSAGVMHQPAYPLCKLETQNWTHWQLDAKDLESEIFCAVLNDRDLSSFSRP
jgi:hypothetical protein